MPEPTRSSPLRRVLQVSLFAFALWLYGGDLVIWVRAHGAEVSVMSAMPSLVLSVLGVAVAVFYGASLVRELTARVRQLAFAAVLSLLFIDFTFIASRRAGLPTEAVLLETVHGLAAQASGESSLQSVARDPRVLRELLPRAAPPIYLKGERVEQWQVEVRERCEGPAAEAGQSPPGTVLYCVASNRQRAWVTVVATREGARFGPAAVVSVQPEWVGEVSAAPEPVEPPRPAPVWGSPTPTP